MNTTGLNSALLRVRRPIMIAIILLLGAGSFLAFVNAWLGKRIYADLAELSITLVMPCVLCLALLTILARGHATRLMYLGLSLCASSVVMGSVTILSDGRFKRYETEIAILGLLTAIVFGWALATMFAGVFVALRAKGKGFACVRFLGLVAVAIGALSWVALLIVAFLEPLRSNPWERVLAVDCISMVILLSMAALLMNRSQRLETDTGLRIAVTCPRCAHAEQIVFGGDRCSTCGLQIRIRRA